jgi:hypothetical protein
MYRLARQRFWVRWRRGWRHGCWAGKRWLALLLVLVLLYGLWPSVTLWRLNQAVLNDDTLTLTTLVDVSAIRTALRRRLNKYEVSVIGALSDDFIDWLDAGIRYHGVTALEQLVTFAWVREQLRVHALPPQDLFPAEVSRSFVGLRDFQVQINTAAPPLVLFLHLETSGWRVVALYY